jgi:hypothetical protein
MRSVDFHFVSYKGLGIRSSSLAIASNRIGCPILGLGRLAFGRIADWAMALKPVVKLALLMMFVKWYSSLVSLATPLVIVKSLEGRKEVNSQT